MKLFFRAYLQTAMVSISTIMISKEILVGVFLVGFTLSLLWTFNISTLAFSTTKQKLIYSLGAGLGSMSGVLIFNFLKF
jgi:hypothetical protein